MAALADVDKERVRYHLGYPNLQQGTLMIANYAVHYAIVNQLENAMNNLVTNAITRIQAVLTTMDTIETQMINALQRLQASKADVVTLNPSEMLDLEVAYKRWQRKLCSIMSVMPYPEHGVYGINIQLAR